MKGIKRFNRKTEYPSLEDRVRNAKDGIMLTTSMLYNQSPFAIQQLGEIIRVYRKYPDRVGISIAVEQSILKYLPDEWDRECKGKVVPESNESIYIVSFFQK